MGIHPKIGITGLPRSGKSAVMQKVVSMLADERVEEMRARGDDVEAAKLLGGMRCEPLVEDGDRAELEYPRRSYQGLLVRNIVTRQGSEALA